MCDTEELIPVGKIIGPHGIKGHMKLNSYSGNAESLRKARSVVMKSSSGALQDFELKGFKANSGKFIISLSGVDDIDQTGAYVGSELCIKRCNLPQLADDEYYWTDLIGLKVYTNDGQLLGPLIDIFETGSSDIYVVQGEGREYLIPAIADVINRVDLSSGTVVITPLEGLLDL